MKKNVAMVDELGPLFEEQVLRLQESHFMILYWATQSEGRGYKYNITNAFDDMKQAGLTRTKQTAVSSVFALSTLCFIDIRDEHNRKNIYITRYGARALEMMVKRDLFKPQASAYLENLQ
ncbi:MAG: hypothetical protein IKS20_01635 [Victivallales bacterium]|nr:hypothetical protein [Victivallales bacterium]MBR6371859.1 hypothetical protein [Victivallales bacterium]